MCLFIASFEEIDRGDKASGNEMVIRHSPPGMPYGFVRIFYFFYSSAAKVSG